MNRKNILHLLSICVRLESSEVTELFIDELIDPLYTLACTAQDNLDLKFRTNKVKSIIHCSKYYFKFFLFKISYTFLFNI